MVKASGVLVMALGLVMLTRGIGLFGIALPTLTPGQGSSVAMAKVIGNYQEVKTTVESGTYHPLIVQKGIPVRWTVSVKADDLNGCNNPLTVPQYGIRKQLVPGDNLIEFIPDNDGTIAYSCWMGMVTSTIRIVTDLATLTSSDLSTPSTASLGTAFQSGGTGSVASCCGATPGAAATAGCCGR
jgi:uncharacterized protein